jgi:hypothetical protein
MPTETTRRPANAEMVEGCLDGRDPSNPEPSDNRSRSYRHGFRSGRSDLDFPRKEHLNKLLQWQVRLWRPMQMSDHRHIVTERAQALL